MKSTIQLKTATPPLLIALALVCFAVVPRMHAVSPPPDGAYAGGNTAEGQNALLLLTTGGFNTAVGFFSLRSDTTSGFNTAIGAGALFANGADQNTATGAGALFHNTSGRFNTAHGAFALFANTTGFFNTATADALASNTTGSDNTATGAGALNINTAGSDNTGNGFQALLGVTGNNNTGVGSGAGANATTGSGNVYIGAGMNGFAGESNSCYIASIFGQTSVNGIPVLINSFNKLGTTTSSKRFKQDIKPMDNTSEALFSLKPVSFRYKKEIDPAGTAQLGLVAEDVEKIDPDLVVRDREGKAYSVRYDQVNAMLLNEFLKEHHTVQEQGATITELKKEIETLTSTVKEQAAQVQKVSAQIEMSQRAARVVVNSP